MKIVKRIFPWPHIDSIPEHWSPFDHIQEHLTSIEPLVIWEYIYWVVTIEFPDITSR